MKSQLSTVLFALLIPLSACGGDRGNSTPTETTRAPAQLSSQPTKLPSPHASTSGVVAELPKRDVVEPSARGLVIPTTYVECMSRGQVLAAQGEHARARELFDAAAKLDKQQSDPHVELARSYISTNDRSLAIKAATKAVKLAPESSSAYNTLGRAELLRHSYDNAIEAFRQATELNPDNVWAWNNLGYTHLQLKNYQVAADALVEATTKPGATAYMFNNLGLAYEQLDELDDARIAFDKGGERGSNEAKASRKRLEGVRTIIVMKSDTDEAPPVGGPAVVEPRSYEAAEPMPELPGDTLTAEPDAAESEESEESVESEMSEDVEEVEDSEADANTESPAEDDLPTTM